MVTYAFLLYALWSRFMRSSVLDNLVQDYVRTARAKGASERRVLWGHVFRNSLVSIVTLLGLSLPGPGRRRDPDRGACSTTRAWDCVLPGGAEQTDYRGAARRSRCSTTLATILGNLLADVGYALLDPRVRY